MDTLSIKKLVPSPANPRKTASKAELKELAASIEAQGIIQPLIVRKVKNNGHFEIIAGHRRFQAAEIAGLKEVPVRIVDVDDTKALEMQIVENLQRSDVDPLEEGEGFKSLITGGASIRDIAAKVGKSRSYVADRMVLANLIGELKNAYRSKHISLANSSLLGRLTSAQQKDAYENRLHNSHPDYLRQEINRRYLSVLADLPFDLSDKDILPAAGPCTKCPKRSSQNSDLFGSIAKEESCLDYECLKKKLAAFLEARVQTLKAKGTDFVTISTEQRASRTEVLPRAYDAKDKGWFEPHKDPVSALIVESRRLKDIGKLVKVSLTPPSNRSASAHEVKRQDAEREERRERELAKRVRRLAFKKLWEMRRVQKKTTIEKLFVFFQHYVNRLSHDELVAIVRALDIPLIRQKGQKGVVGAIEYAKSFDLWLSEYENEDLYHMGMLFAVAGDLMVSEWRQNGDQLAVLAKLYGIDPKECRREILDSDARAKAQRDTERKAAREAAKSTK